MKKYLVILTFLLAIIICVSIPITVTASITSLSEGEKAETSMDTEAPTSAVEPATEAKVIPSAIKGLTVSSVNSDSLILNWDKSNNADMYTIYRANETNNGKFTEYKKHINTKSNSFKDTNLSAAKIYKYQVFAYRISGEDIYQSMPSTVSVMTKLKDVTSASLSDKKTSSMKLNWKKSAVADKYIIYRSEEKSDGSFGGYKKLREVKSGAKLYFTDKKLSGGTVFKYKIEAQRSQNGNSAVSSGKIVTGMTKLKAPAGFKKLKATETSIKLGWKPVEHADKYDLFRDGVKINSVKATSYTDRKLLSGSLHNYSVRAVRKVGKNVRSGISSNINASCKLSANRIEVSISKQTLTMYIKNKVYLKTPVITGAPGDRATAIGHHHIISRKSPAVLKGSYRGSKWTTTVSYWLGFTYSGQGIHDATWQSAFGGQLYRQGRGSHGCVNTPTDAVRRIYEKAYVGMLLIVKP